MNTTTTKFDSRSADRYEFVHGKRPRGEGFWSFSFDGIEQSWGTYAKYGEAKRRAMVEARLLDVQTVSVES